MPFVCDAAGSEEVLQKPKVDRWESTTHQQSRAGVDIDHVVIHYTTSRNVEGTIGWFKSAPKGQRASAHYIVDRQGNLIQMVPDEAAAWHAGSKAMNLRSIGIEHVAAAGDEITAEQSATSAALVGWLCETYAIPRKQVIPHVAIKPTDCCGDLFKAYGGKRGASAKIQSAAIQEWLTKALGPA